MKKTKEIKDNKVKEKQDKKQNKKNRQAKEKSVKENSISRINADNENDNSEDKKEKKEKGIKNLLKILTFQKQERTRLIVYIILTAITTALSLLYPMIEKEIYASVAQLAFKRFILSFVVYYALDLFLYGVLYRINSLIINRATNNIWKSTSRRAFERIFPMAFTKIDGENTGKMYNRIVQDPSNLSGIVVDIVDKLSGIIMRVGYLVIIFMYNWKIALYMSLCNVVIWFLQDIRIRARVSTRKKVRKIADKRSGISKEAFNGIRDIKCLDMDKPIIDMFDNSLESQVNIEMQYVKKSNIVLFIIQLFRSATWIGFAFLAVYLLKLGELDFAMLILMYSYSGTIRAVIDSIVSLKEYVADKEVVAKRVMEVFDETIYPQDKFGDVSLDNASGLLQMNDVCFGYPNCDLLFENLNVTFEPNKLTAIVGKSGEGKSTISSLLFHLYDISAGSITLDGIDIKDLDKPSLKNNLSVIPQSPYIFNLTVKENLRLVCPNATDEQIWKALEDAQLKEFVQELPKGLDSVVGENGVKMSGGQKQRLAIARALLKNSPVIIFDEATSSLDNQAQAEIQKVTEKLKGNHTLIVIAHRLSTIKNADKIVVLDNHKVAAVGNHEELMNTCKVYKDLYVDEQV